MSTGFTLCLPRYLCSKMVGYTHSVVQTYIHALIYEPSNIAPAIKNQDHSNSSRDYWTYIGNKHPIESPKYLQEFAHQETRIIDGPEILNCKGVGNCSHPFLAADGFKLCTGRNEMVYMHCQASIGDKTHCLLCYSQESLVPLHGEE